MPRRFRSILGSVKIGIGSPSVVHGSSVGDAMGVAAKELMRRGVMKIETREMSSRQFLIEFAAPDGKWHSKEFTRIGSSSRWAEYDRY